MSEIPIIFSAPLLTREDDIMVDSPTNSGLVRLLEVYGNPSHTFSH